VIKTDPLKGRLLLQSKTMQTQSQLTGNPQGALLNVGENTRTALFIICIAFCLPPFTSPAIALLMGLAIAQLTGHPYIHLNHKATHILLQASVVGLGFGMNVHSAMQA
jgi:hypothetical protein